MKPEAIIYWCAVLAVITGMSYVLSRVFATPFLTAFLISLGLFAAISLLLIGVFFFVGKKRQ